MNRLAVLTMLQCAAQQTNVKSAERFAFLPVKARGSAMTEFYFLTMILLPIFFGIPMIGKLVDMKQNAVQAGRYSAWESTVHANLDRDGNASAFLKDRFFGDQESVISSAPSEVGENSLWGESAVSRGMDEKSAIRINGSSVMLSHASIDGVSGVAERIGSTVRTAGRAIGSFSDGDWDLTANGMVQSSIAFEVQANNWIGDATSDCGSGAGFGCLMESSVILTDGWSAGSDSEAENRVKSLVPASALHKVGELVSNVGRIPVFEELKDLGDAFGYVTMKPLPASEALPRYKEYER